MAVTLLPNSTFKLTAADDTINLRMCVRSITWVTTGTGGAFTGETKIRTVNPNGTVTLASSGSGVSAFGSGTLGTTAEVHNLYDEGLWLDGFRLLTLPSGGYVVISLC